MSRTDILQGAVVVSHAADMSHFYTMPIRVWHRRQRPYAIQWRAIPLDHYLSESDDEPVYVVLDKDAWRIV